MGDSRIIGYFQVVETGEFYVEHNGIYYYFTNPGLTGIYTVRTSLDHLYETIYNHISLRELISAPGYNFLGLISIYDIKSYDNK